MEKRRNPFAPGAGTPPPELVGRQEHLEEADVALHRIKAGRPAKSFLLVGLRGVGKTVLLNEIQNIADSEDYKTVFIEAIEGKRLHSLLLPVLRQLLFGLDRHEQVSERVKKALRILKSFANAIKVKYENIEFSLDIDPEDGIADSGDLELDLPPVLTAVADAARARQTQIALIIDEMQYLNESELGALIMAIHRINQKQLPLVLVGAGLPQLVGLTGKAKSYAERLFNFPEIGALSHRDTIDALQKPVEKEGVKFTKEALDQIVDVTQGYPYFLQEWGYSCWNLADTSPITEEVVLAAKPLVTTKLDENFFRVRFDRLTPREKDYLRAVAELGPGQHRSGDIADIMGVKVQSAAPLRSSLIKKGMIYSPAHGDTKFTVPLFDEFMKRIMPNWKP